MWMIAGHKIGLAGGPYLEDHGDPMVNVRCYDCAHLVGMSWCLWTDPDETGNPPPTGPVLRAVVEHLRDSDIEISEDDVSAAVMMAALSNDVTDALDMLAERFKAQTPPT